MRPFLLGATVVAALCLGRTGLASQEVRLEGRTGNRATRELRQILERDNYQLIRRDTILSYAFFAEGDVLVVNADVRLEGRVEGSVAVVRGRLFVRPGAQVSGAIAAIGGGIYPSALAQVGDTVTLPFRYRVEVMEVGEGLQITVSPPPPDYLALPGLFGLRLPSYDRVDGLTLRWGPEWQLSGYRAGPLLDTWVSYHSARGEVGGGATLDLPLGSGLHAIATGSRETLTNDAWIRGDLTNTLSSFGVASDRRNYYESDRISISLIHRNDTPLIAGEYAFSPWIRYQGSRDRSLRARDPWALLGDSDDWRANPPIAEGTMVSVGAGTELRWKGMSTEFQGQLGVEHALPGPGDFEFTRWSVEAEWDMDALWQHQISVYTRAFGTLGDDPAPPQRWSFIGGSGTLPTFDVSQFRGDRLAYIESTYGIPIPSIMLPVLGSPTIEIIHQVGMAWMTGHGSPPWEQNLGLGVELTFVDAHLYIDPVDRTTPVLSAGLSFPSF